MTTTEPVDVSGERQTSETIRRLLLNETAAVRREQRQRPTVEIYDRNWENPRPLWGELESSFEDKLNNTGEAKIPLFATHREAEWLVNEVAEEEDVHIVVHAPGMRWAGKVSTVTVEPSGGGLDRLTINALHDFEHVKKIICYSNPFLPPEFQWPKIFSWAGGSIGGIRTIIFLNLLRRFAPLWSLPENLYDQASWSTNLDPSTWPIVIKPQVNFLADTSMWTVITTRFGNCFDVISPTLNDAGLHLVAERWLPGDPQPAPGYFTLTKPTLVLDIVDKSGVRGPSGTALDGLLKLGARILDDGFTQEVVEQEWGTAPPQYGVPGFLGTVNDHPWVSFRNGMRTGLSGISSWKMTIHKPLAGSVVTGGRSPSWVNSGIKLLLNAVLGYLGMLFGNPGLALGIFDKQVEDVVLAFHKTAHNVRQGKMGRNQYGEHWENTGGTGFSVSVLQAIRVGFWKTRAYTSYEVELVNGAPFWVGKHFQLGDRVSAEIGTLTGRAGRLYVDQVHSTVLTWGRGADPTHAITIGDGSAEEQPGAILSRQLEHVRALVQSLGVDS